MDMKIKNLLSKLEVIIASSSLASGVHNIKDGVTGSRTGDI